MSKTTDYPGDTVARVYGSKTQVKLGLICPDFKIASTEDEPYRLKERRGKHQVLFFYPKDDTSGCTQEAHDFSENLKLFKKLGAEVFGISRDSLKSHFKFIEKQDYQIHLLSDPEETICRLFDVMKEKSMYGKKYMGIERSTFVISSEGKLIKEWRKLKVKEHVAEVLSYLEGL